MKKYMPPAIVAAVSAVTHFVFFGYPAQVVFDETFAGRFLGDYARGSFFFDVHPPLAKLIVYAVGFLTGASYGSDMGAIGDALPHSVVLLRLIPMAFGFLLPLIIYAIGRNIGLSKMAAMVAGLVVALENSLVVQSRFILFDSMLLTFGFGALLCWQEYDKRRAEGRLVGSRGAFLAASAILAACSYSVKWTGLAFLLAIIILESRTLYARKPGFIRKLASLLAVYAVAGIIIYAGTFAVHFALLPHPGSGDAFVSSGFHSENLAGQMIDLNYDMFSANSRMSPHQYQSSWWSWPLMLRPIFYWQGSNAYIYLLGDPFTYWLSSLAMLFVTGYVIRGVIRRRYGTSQNPGMNGASVFLLVCFGANYIPFMFITRPMFLYHYQAALAVAILAVAWILDGIKIRKWKMIAVAAVTAMSLCGFIYWSPLTYGLPLDQNQLQARMWLSGWR
ncbi:MAG: phospholipid carrier-dependent glycosyltransferase [Patescibacteria group bacterium]|nr:phospholipid carrier-dependent glycosyltransferase [Patescibacteria group bacterium]